MSKAFKCDKCQHCFDPAGIGNALMVTIKEVEFQDGIAYKANKVNNRYESLNLCPACTVKFIGFLNPEK